MEEKKGVIFPEGVSFFKPREGAPEFVKGNLVITLSELTKFAEEMKLGDTVRIDMNKSTKGNIYLALNTWKPKPVTKKEEF